MKSVIWSIKGDKSPSLDGFIMAFFKMCWEVRHRDVMLSVEDFYKKTFLDKGSNVTFISLIPKNAGADTIKDFKPISLICITHKIILKVLANWLKEVLDFVITPYQSAFIGGRQ